MRAVNWKAGITYLAARLRLPRLDQEDLAAVRAVQSSILAWLKNAAYCAGWAATAGVFAFVLGVLWNLGPGTAGTGQPSPWHLPYHWAAPAGALVSLALDAIKWVAWRLFARQKRGA